MPDMPQICPGCDTEIAPNLLTCPNCHRLIHADRLKVLADEATHAATPAEAMVAWRSALELLPPGTRQHVAITAKLTELGQLVDAQPPAAAAKSATGWGGAAGVGGLALLAWKFKAIALLVVTKGKFLLMGLTKASTFTSMALMFGVYWTAFGWQFALGLVVSIYIHEMGHVAALLRYGVKASAPLFIPGLGAFIRLQQSLGDPRQDARVGLAGPVWGLGAALACFGLWKASDQPIWAVLARFGAMINLFNLLPLWTLDGGRAFRAMNRSQRWLALLGLAAVWSLSTSPEGSGLLILLILGGLVTTAAGKAPAQPDPKGFLAYIALVGVLTWLLELPDPLAVVKPGP